MIVSRAVRAAGVGAAGGCAAAAVLLSATAPALADPALPADASTSGYIGLCDGHGTNITGGSVDATPFAWQSVSSVPAPEALRGPGQNTVLEIYQVRPGVDPQEWSGDQLTATSFYDGGTPAAQATRADLSLRVIVSEFPPQQDGLYELRMYFGRVNHGVYNATYPATFIRVSGDSWHVVGAPRVDCAHVRAVSNEVLTGVVTRAQASPPPPAAAPGAGGAASSGGPSTFVLATGAVAGAVAAVAVGVTALARARRRRVA